VAEGSGNVANDGMFSIQVLSRALEVFGLQTVPLSSPDAADARADPTTQAAFICNLQARGLASPSPLVGCPLLLAVLAMLACIPLCLAAPKLQPAAISACALCAA
jgi:hypothetical protein